MHRLQLGIAVLWALGTLAMIGAWPAPAPEANPVQISIASSIGKQPWMHEAIRQFNTASPRDPGLQLNGKPIRVDIVQETVDGVTGDYRSGTMIADTISERIKPTVLSPADASSIVKLQNDWNATRRNRIARDNGPALASTPLVIATWESRARALGCWPASGPDCTWQRMHALATSPIGWGELGRPEWGKFKLGYPYVGEAATGTYAAVLMCMVGAGKTSGLTIADVDVGSGCGAFMAGVEMAKTHSGTSGPWLLDQMVEGGLEYLDAIVAFEVNLISFNLAQGNSLREPIVAVYPQDGTVIADHPFTILDGAPWVSPEQLAAAKVFHGFLLSNERQRALLAMGLRPAAPNTRLESPVDPRFGANPQANLAVIDPPDSLVMDRIAEVWHRVKKHAVMTIVFDKSGNMVGARMDAAVKGAQQFVQRMDRDDYVIWMPFDSSVHPPVEGYLSETGKDLAYRIGSTPAGGGTALYDAILQAGERLEAMRSTYGATRRYGMVVLSGGADTSSGAGLSIVELKLTAQEADPTGIQIHTIAIGNEADPIVLRKIASAGHGRFWKGQTASEMVAVYESIATYY
jgi:Ca-activated chloride channel homolog